MILAALVVAYFGGLLATLAHQYRKTIRSL